MTRYCLLLSAVFILVACGNAQTDADTLEVVAAEAATMLPADTMAASVSDAAAAFDADGAVLITVDRVISEPDACLLMMSVVNGTDDTVTAGLFAFDVTGNGETAGGNMFPQTTDAGDVKTAQIILPGTSCANAQEIEGGQINCRIAETGESCIEVTELRDGAVAFNIRSVSQ